MIHSLTLAEKIAKIPAIRHDLDATIQGHTEAKDYIVKSFLNGEHILIEGYPGNGKTELVKAFAGSIGADIKRIQGTNDLLPQDIVGYVGADGKFRRGPIFTNILIVDEINRIPSKTLSGLISAMAEGVVVTDDGKVEKLPDFFFVIATQNPHDNSGVYDLPEAIRDRFGVKICIHKEAGALKTIYRLKNPDTNIVSDRILDMISQLFDQLDPNFTTMKLIKDSILVGPSIRAGLSYIEYVKTNAYVEGRNLVVEEDVFKDIVNVFRDKIILTEDAVMEGRTADEVLKEFVGEIGVELGKKG